MAVILGITDGDDAGAVLLVDGRIVAAVNDERLNRMKMSIGFPRMAIQEVLRLGGVGPRDVDEVGMASVVEEHIPEPIPNEGWFREHSGMTSIQMKLSASLAKPLGRFPPAFAVYRALKRATFGNRRAGVQRLLGELAITAPISYHDHHLCHTLAAFETSGFENAVSISLDGGGDYKSGAVWVHENGWMRLLNDIDSFHSIGNYYAYVTHLCGYRANIHEGKITGLAATGEPRYLDMFREMVTYADGQITNAASLYHTTAVDGIAQRLPAGWKHEDLACSIQTHLEEVVVPYVHHWVRESGQRHVCLSGGVFANVRLNQKIAELDEVDGVYVFPAMGDGGMAAGSALAAYLARDGATLDRRTPYFADVYLGASFGDAEIEAALRDAGVDYRREDDVEDAVAELVHRGHVVARFDGRMEYGPRALGNRSILYHTKDASVNAWLNNRLHRTEFMPFAPACLPSAADQLFHWNHASARATGFMTITLDCTDWMKEHCPAVVHVDGTARPQMVHEEANPSFHRIIRRYEARSGIPCIVNTSFNMHEEPIVCTPADAIRSFQEGRLDNLAIGPFLLGPPAGAVVGHD